MNFDELATYKKSAFRESAMYLLSINVRINEHVSD